ncbi:MAG: PHP domain-containing protein, partial [bacterium]
MANTAVALDRDLLAADFHLHSRASDGSDPPRRVMERAKAAGLRAVALTDHDTVAGLEEAAGEAKRLGLEFICGIELSTMEEGRIVHILGHFIDPAARRLLEWISPFGRIRKGRMDRILEKLGGLGVTVDPADFYGAYGEGNIGRGHLGAYLLERGMVRTREEAFRLYLGEEAPAYVALDALRPGEGVELIGSAGGTATFAHPLLSGADEIIPALVSAGLAGIEVNHPS